MKRWFLAVLALLALVPGFLGVLPSGGSWLAELKHINKQRKRNQLRLP